MYADAVRYGVAILISLLYDCVIAGSDWPPGGSVLNRFDCHSPIVSFELIMKKILLVDDSSTVRIVGKRYCHALGFETLEAENGKTALEVVLSNPDIDVILLDWNMPVMDGLSFLKALREKPLARQPLVVMCTTENDIAHISEAMHAGANEYIMKPFSEEIVLDKLEELGVL